MNAPSCATCRFWCRDGAQIAKAERDPAPGQGVGTCQVGPPQLVKVVGSWVEGCFPQTHETRFCGEWEPIGEPDDGGGEEVENNSNVIPMAAAA